MPRKNSNTERFGGSGSRNHPEKFHKSEGPHPGQPTSGREFEDLWQRG